MSRIPLNVDPYEGNDTPGSETARFVVLYGKASTRKHKIWEGDGILICYPDACILKSEDERDTICRSSALKNLDMLEDGRIINIGSWSVEIQERIERKCAPAPAPRPPALLPKAPPPNAPKPPAPSSSPPVKRPARRSFVPPLIGDSPGEIKPPPPQIVLNEQQVLSGEAPPLLVDPRFSRALREHQKVGIRFIYEKLTGNSRGAILGDEMGLGKSIQTMAATWAILKGAKPGQNLASSCLIIVPSSLVNNWKAEFDKWWRNMRFPAVIVETAKDITSYQSTLKTMPYLVISYDLALRNIEKLRAIRFDIIVCDEAHKLKSVRSQLRKALVSLAIPRRLLLTGTPFQNNVVEFHSLLDFVRPEAFGTPAEFERNVYHNPDADPTFDGTLLRRKAEDVNTSHLPKKFEHILFCAASSIQKHMHSEICEMMTADAFSMIFFARQLANHPKLLLDNLREKHEKGNTKGSALLVAFDGPTMPRGGVKESGKLTVLVDMLKCFRNANERSVIVSNFIETLDMIEQLCEYLQFQIYRLDGKTQVADRQKIVRDFNDKSSMASVFLLSTKAGGAGLNLTGASRLVLFDSDWNPANDQQAMARIWRDGQVRECQIYRLVTTGTIEEKMLQRQIKKTGLGCVIDAIEVADTMANFTDEELKDIFTFTDTECNTHDLSGCECDGNGMLRTEYDSDEEEEEEKKETETEDSDDDEEVDDEELEADVTVENLEEVVEEVVEETKETKMEEKVASLAELFLWRHYSPRHPRTWQVFLRDSGLTQVENNLDDVTFAFYQQSQF